MRGAGMKSVEDKAASRPLGVAEKLTSGKIDSATVYGKKVVLTGEREFLLSDNGRWCLLDAVTLLGRVVGDLTVIVPDGAEQLESEVKALCQELWARRPVNILREGHPFSIQTADAILSVGKQARPSLPWTVVNSNGWVARVSSGAEDLPSDVAQPNPLGALMAASLGVTEVFKRIFGVPHDIAPLADKIELSLFDQTVDPDWIGPPLPDSIHLPDTLLVGGGAIGNGIALLLSQLVVTGRLHIIDNQDYGDENFGTCILLGRRGWIGVPKAERLTDWLKQNSKLSVTGEKDLIQTAKDGEMVSSLSIDLILNGLDKVDARQEAQSLWPSTIVDGGISDVGAAVIQYRLGQDDCACLKCWFDTPKVDEQKQQSKLTGLPIDALADLGRKLTDADLERATEEKRAWLSECVKQGKTVCSVISEAALTSKLGVEVENNFRPSVPFVATASAAMVVAEAIKAIIFPTSKTASKFQIDSLFSDIRESMRKLRMRPSAVCQCVVHRNRIIKLQKKRQKSHTNILP
jgi:hypothetical protein